MINVLDLLSQPLLKNFKLISSAKGLSNPVSGLGIFEWESPEEIETTFSSGEFILTTLSMAKNDINDAICGLQALIQKGVSAIAIKTVYFDNCPEEIIAMADLYKIPVFIFSDTYIDDLVYIIKNAILSDDTNTVLQKHLYNILKSTSENDILTNARNINPFFYEHLICFCLIPPHNDFGKGFEDILRNYRKNQPAYTADIPRHSLIKCNNCFILIYTESEKLISKNMKFFDLLASLSIPYEKFIIGISDIKENLTNIKTAIEEAEMAAISSVMENENCRTFCEIGSDSLIIPVLNEDHFLHFYNKNLTAIKLYDENHTSNLLETLLCYIESDGDISLTSKKLFQHSNTIRYRINKIKHILQIDGNPDAFIQLYIFTKMHKIISTFGNEPMKLV